MGAEASGATEQSVESWNIRPATDDISVFSNGPCHLNEQSPLSREVGINRIRTTTRTGLDWRTSQAPEGLD